MKYFFDNNLPPKFAELLRLVSGESIVHIDAADGLHRDTKDEKWMPIVAQRNWVAVTSGVRISTAPHQRELRQQLGIATVFLLKGWSNFRFHEQTWRIIKYRPEIKKHTTACVKGACFYVSVNGKFEKR